jgi:hypothetical protein
MYLTDVEINSLKDVNRMYREMINNILRLRSNNFSTLKLPRFDYAYQTEISLNRVDLATACAIYYYGPTQAWLFGISRASM